MPKPVEVQADEVHGLNSIEKTVLESEVIEALRMVYDPELPVNIYDLGLIYNVEISDEADVHVLMTLTSPACPVAGSLPGEVEMAVAQVPGVRRSEVELTWDPPFTIEMMSEDVRLALGLY